MEKNIKVSVILPVYNTEQYIGQTLECMLNQTLQEIEVICVDDGSTDNSLEIMNEYAKKDSRVKVICQQNAGAGAARNNGMREAKGKYLSFLDADDFFEPDMLELAYNKAVAERSDVVVFNSNQYFEETDSYKNINWTIRKEALPPYSPMTHFAFTDNVFKVFVGWAWDKLFDAEFVKKYDLKYQEQRTSNDLLFVFSAIVLADRISIVDKILVHQRRNVQGSLSNTREHSWDCFYHALNALKETLVKHNLEYALRQDYINYALHFSLWHLDTITGAKKEVLFNKLKEEWFEEFGIVGKDADYFYNKKEYAKYEKIMNHTFEEYVA